MKPISLTFDEASSVAIAEFLVLTEYEGVSELVRKSINDHIRLVRHLQQGKKILIVDEENKTAVYHNPMS